jgi:uncharacterized coiled-coil DUF342 family protein
VTIWEILNSPFFLTITSISLGGIIATTISAAWQRKSQRHSLRITLTKEILDLYHDYIRYIKNADVPEAVETFDRLHSGFISKAKMAKVLFNDEIESKLKKIANKLATVHDLKIHGRVQKAKSKYQDLFEDADEILEKLFQFLK